MFDQSSGHFWTGTSDPTHIFFNNSPEDVQTWSYLAFQDPNFAVSLDWVKTNLATTDSTFTFHNGWGVLGSLRLRVSGVTYASLSKLGVGGCKRRCGRSLARRHQPSDCRAPAAPTACSERHSQFSRRYRSGQFTARERASRAKQPGRESNRERTGASNGAGNYGCDQHPKHRLRLQLFPAPPHRSHILVRDGGARSEPAADTKSVGMSRDSISCG